MKILDRYIFKHLFLALVVSTTVLLGLIWLINSLKFLDWFINKGLSIITFLKITLMLMPGFLTVFSPIALFAVTVFAYSRFMTDRELTVMRSVGLGSWRLARPALILALFMTAFGYMLTLAVVPELERAFDKIRVQVREDISALVLRDGQFNQIDRNITVFLGERGADGTLKDLVIYDTVNPERSTTILAESGALILEDGPPRFILLNGSRQEWDREGQRASFLYFDSYTLSFKEEGGVDGFRYPKENQRGFWELLRPRVGDEISPEIPFTYTQSQINRLRLEAHQRLLQPLNHFGFILIGLAAILSSQFRRYGNGRPVLLAVAVVVLFQAADLGASSMAKKSITGLIAYDLAFLLPILIGVLWMADAPRAFRNLFHKPTERTLAETAA